MSFNQNEYGRHSTTGYSECVQRLFMSRSKLKAVSRTSALLSGFAMVALVETGSVSSFKQLPLSLIIAFTLCTTVLVSVHILALLMSTCTLPYVEMLVAGINEASESPELYGSWSSNETIAYEQDLRFYIDTAWALSTGFGIILFALEVILICWVRFYSVSLVAAGVGTVAVIPVIIGFFAFGINFYSSVKNRHLQANERELEGIVTKVNFDHPI